MATIARIALFYAGCCLDAEHVRGESPQSILKEIEDVVQKSKYDPNWAKQGYEIRLLAARPLGDAITEEEEDLMKIGEKFYFRNIKGCKTPLELFDFWNSKI